MGRLRPREDDPVFKFKHSCVLHVTRNLIRGRAQPRSSQYLINFCLPQGSRWIVSQLDAQWLQMGGMERGKVGWSCCSPASWTQQPNAQDIPPAFLPRKNRWVWPLPTHLAVPRQLRFPLDYNIIKRARVPGKACPCSGLPRSQVYPISEHLYNRTVITLLVQSKCTNRGSHITCLNIKSYKSS